MNKKISFPIAIIIIIVLAILVGWLAIWWYLVGIPKMEEKTVEVKPLEEVSRKNETVDWQTYKNKKIGIEFKYPKELVWEIDVSPVYLSENDEGNDYGKPVVKLLTLSGKIKHTDFVVIREINGKINQDSLIKSNYSSSGYFRLGDAEKLVIGNKHAYIMHEGDAGYLADIVLIPFTDNALEISCSVWWGADVPENYQTLCDKFDLILSTFKFAENKTQI